MNSFNVVMIGPYPRDENLGKGGVQAAVAGLSAALSHDRRIGRVIGLSDPASGEEKSAAGKGAIGGAEVTYLTAPLRWQASGVVNVPAVLRTIRSAGRASSTSTAPARCRPRSSSS